MFEPLFSTGRFSLFSTSIFAYPFPCPSERPILLLELFLRNGLLNMLREIFGAFCVYKQYHGHIKHFVVRSK
jgi:hypothetical protein